jgi:hypothetical protein
LRDREHVGGVVSELGDLPAFTLKIEHAAHSGRIILRLADALTTGDLTLQFGLLVAQLLDLADNAIGYGVAGDAQGRMG